MAFHVPTAQEIVEAAEYWAVKDAERDFCDPSGRWYNDRNIKGWLNPATAAESEISAREGSIAYRLYVKTYLQAQGWKR